MDIASMKAPLSEQEVRAFKLLSEDTNAFVRQAVVKNMSCPSLILKERATKDTDEYVLYFVALHPNTPSTCLPALSTHENPYIRGAVARNPNTSARTLRKLSEDASAYVRGFVAGNLSTSVAVLKALAADVGGRDVAADPELRVVTGLAGNPNTPPSVLDALSLAHPHALSRRLAANPAVFAKTLHRLARSKDVETRRLVAANPSTKFQTLELLCLDADDFVRSAVARAIGRA